jgi:hypothetical protein
MMGIDNIIVGSLFGSGMIGTVVWSIVKMHFSLQTLILAVTEMKETVKDGNLSSVVLAKQMSLLDFRVSAIEDEQKRMRKLQERAI